jgi:chromosomal replication initiator protein
VTALARISRERIDIDFAASALRPLTPSVNEGGACTPDAMIDTVCRYFGIEHAAIVGQKRDRAITYARHLAMYLLRQQAGLSYSTIAYLLGKKDHSTVVHACNQIHKEIKRSPQLQADIDALLTAMHSTLDAA